MNFIQEHIIEDKKYGEYICPKCSNHMIIPNYHQYSEIYCITCEPKKEWKFINQAAKCNCCRAKDNCSRREFNFIQID